MHASMSYRVVAGLFGLFMGCFSIALVACLFRDRLLSRFHWGKGGRTPVSRTSILVVVPFSLYFSAKPIAVALGYEWPWAIPVWLFAAWFALFFLCQARDITRAKNSNLR